MENQGVEDDAYLWIEPRILAYRQRTRLRLLQREHARGREWG